MMRINCGGGTDDDGDNDNDDDGFCHAGFSTSLPCSLVGKKQHLTKSIQACH